MLNNYLKDKKGFSTLVIILLSLVAIIILGIIGTFIYKAAINLYFEASEKLEKSEDSTQETNTTRKSENSETTMKGYSSVTCSNMSLTLLKPYGWYIKEETNGNTEACFITKEYLGSATDEFKTGLSINAIQNMETATGKTASEYAKAYIELAGEKYNGSPVNLGKTGPFESYAVQVNTEPEGYYKITMYFLAFANSETDTVYIMWFESPTEEWEKEWVHGKSILEKIKADANY